MTLNVLDIVPGTSVDGPGLRTAIYLAGCNHACPGCHNPDSWDPEGGRRLSVDRIVATAEAEGFPVTLTGGDPLCSPDATLALAHALSEAGLGPLWLYTGYTFEAAAANPALRRVLEAVDVVVDGPFVSSLADRSLLFRGSSNQRIVMSRESLAHGRILEWAPPSFPDL